MFVYYSTPTNFFFSRQSVLTTVSFTKSKQLHKVRDLTASIIFKAKCVKISQNVGMLQTIWFHWFIFVNEEMFS